jgi:hypothetical protein
LVIILLQGAAAPTPTPVKSPCEQCFTSLLQVQITNLLRGQEVSNIAELCTLLANAPRSAMDFRGTLTAAGITGTTQDNLIVCLGNLGLLRP